ELCIGIDQLAEEILLNIFQYLTDLKDLLTLRLVNKRIASIAMDNVFTQHVVVTRQYHMTTGMLRSFISPVADKINFLDLNFCYWIELKDLNCLLSCKNLHTLHMLQVRVDEVFLCDILSHLPNLTSLSFSVTHIGKLQHQLSLCQTARDCLSRIRRLGLYFWNNSNFIPNLSIEAAAGASFLEIFKCLEEFHVYGSIYSPSRTSSYYLMPAVKDASILSNLKVMSLNFSEDIKATSFFYGTLHSVCKIIGTVQLNTLLQPFYNWDRGWRGEDYEMTMENMTTLVHLNISRVSMHILDDYFNFETARNLVYLNLSGNGLADSECLRYLSLCCPQLVSINLRNCNGIFISRTEPFLEHDENESLVKDLTGIQSLVLNCMRLKELNISGLHHHPTGQSSKLFKNFSEILSLNSNWESLSISQCCMYADYDYEKWTLRSVNSDSLFVSYALVRFIRGTPDMKNFELYCPGNRFTFTEDYGIQSLSDTFALCRATFNLFDYSLAITGIWMKLTTLQLTGLEGVNLGYLLRNLANRLRNLETLCIASYCCPSVPIDNNTFFPSFSKLKDFRLEHPFVSVNQFFVSSLANSPTLERICIISHTYKFDADTIKQLFEIASNIICFQLYTFSAIETCKNLQKFLMEKYSQSRPALRVCIFNLLDRSIQNDITDALPDVHIEEMTILRSKVATIPPRP
ncbi:F-box/LRR-repeat protein 18, partial [Biomphalaria pfeifferi]